LPLAPPSSRWLLPLITLLVGVLGVTVIWVAVAILSNRPCGWLALLAAAAVAVLLRLTQAPSGRLRIAVAVFACALAIALAMWMIAATHLGSVFGLDPVSSAVRLGTVLAWEMTRLSLHPLDWLFIGLSLPLAGWWGRGARDVD
jgi:hypothetical protein